MNNHTLVAGFAEGKLLRLERPLSFWGGIDPDTGNVTDPRHPQHGQTIAHRVLAMEKIIGSSSGSSILLELISNGNAPAAIVLLEPDAILALAAIVGKELGHPPLPIVQVSPEVFATLANVLRIHQDGSIEALN